MTYQPVVLIIRDGWGVNPGGAETAEKDGNAVELADAVGTVLYKVSFCRLDYNALMVSVIYVAFLNILCDIIIVSTGGVVFKCHVHVYT